MLSDAELVAAAIGPNNTRYYLDRFERFAAGGRLASWSWPAFFVSLGWLLYRKLWLHAALYFFGGTALYVTLTIALFAALGPAGAVLALALHAALAFVLVPTFANALYYRAVQRRMAVAKQRGERAQQLGLLARAGGTSNVAVIVIVLAIVPTFGVGVTAAIAIPAYRDFGIRSQVSEGFALAAPIRTAIAHAFRASGAVPADLAAAGLAPDPHDHAGKYVDSVDVTGGRIDIRYGNTADAALAGRVLSMTPYAFDAAVADGPPLAWRCGAGSEPEGASRALAEYRPGSLAVDLPRFVPSSCRP